MFQTIRNAFSIKELRNKILFTFIMLIVIRIGCNVPIPGVDSSVIQDFLANLGDSSNIFTAFTGGSLENMSLFALGISPYITSSIIMQLMTIAFPKLEEMQRDGEQGRKKMNKITRYVTVGLALIQAGAMTYAFTRSGAITGDTNAELIFYAITVVVTMTAGSAVLMWIGERITENGLGNGISIVLIINILSRIPSDLTTLYNTFVSGRTAARATLAGVIIIAIILAVIIMVIFLQNAERRIPVQYSGKLQGKRQAGGASSVIPLKVNTAGVIPVIFAQSIMQTPVIIASFVGYDGGTTVGGKIMTALSQGNWFNTSDWLPTIGAVVYILLIFGFAYFYTAITFNPLEIANNLKRSGGTIPGIRSGKPTSDYLQSVLNYIIFIGAIGLSFVAILPLVFNGIFGANVSFGGTSIIIIVGVIIETLKQAESQMVIRNYRGFLNDK